MAFERSKQKEKYKLDLFLCVQYAAILFRVRVFNRCHGKCCYFAKLCCLPKAMVDHIPTKNMACGEETKMTYMLTYEGTKLVRSAQEQGGVDAVWSQTKQRVF